MHFHNVGQDRSRRNCHNHGNFRGKKSIMLKSTVILEEIPVIEIAGNKLTILKDVPNVDDSCKNYVAETYNTAVTIIENVLRHCGVAANVYIWIARGS